jgi:hypothetical protein
MFHFFDDKYFHILFTQNFLQITLPPEIRSLPSASGRHPFSAIHTASLLRIETQFGIFFATLASLSYPRRRRTLTVAYTSSSAAWWRLRLHRKD